MRVTKPTPEHIRPVNNRVGELTSILKNLLRDVESDLLLSITNQAQSEVLDDLLDQAEAYEGKNNKNGAGVLASVVFEDTVRRIARMSDDISADDSLNKIIDALAGKKKLSRNKAKRCKAAAGARNAALHAKWDEYEMSDVKATIDLTRELLDKHLAG